MADLFGQNQEQTVSVLLNDKDLKNSLANLNNLNFLSLRLKAKELVTQVDWVITQRKNEFLQKILELKEHKSIQVRRKAATACGLLGTSEILQFLKQWQLQESDRQTWLVLESGIDKISRKITTSKEELTERVFSVSEALELIKLQIGQKTYTIEGEISEPKLFQTIYYFSLKDNQEVRLEARAFIGKIMKLGFPLNEGLTVRVSGKFKLTKNSRIIFDVETLVLTGEGELLRNLKLLEQKLRAEGLFDDTRKRKLKTIPENILLIASPNSAALTDFQKILNRRIGGRKIYFLPVKTQGINAEFEILEKLRISEKIIASKKIDTVVLTRGGGSKDDLFVFNSEKIVRALHGISVPVIVAIGHERDVTLSELVADKRASTPSQAAELVCLGREEIYHRTQNLGNQFLNYFNHRKQSYSQTCGQLITLISHKVKSKIYDARIYCHKIDNFVKTTINRVRTESKLLFLKAVSDYNLNYLQPLKQSTDFLTPTIFTFKMQLNEVRQKLDWKNREMRKNLEFRINTTKQSLNNIFNLIKNLNPKVILEKGYALICQEGKVIPTKKLLDQEKPVIIEFVDGQVKGRIDQNLR